MQFTGLAERSTFRSHHDDIHHIRPSQRARFLVLTVITSTRRRISSWSGVRLSIHRFSDAYAFHGFSILHCGLQLFNLRTVIGFCLGDRSRWFSFVFGYQCRGFARTAAPNRSVLICSALTFASSQVSQVWEVNMGYTLHPETGPGASDF